VGHEITFLFHRWVEVTGYGPHPDVKALVESPEGVMFEWNQHDFEFIDTEDFLEKGDNDDHQ